MVDEPEFYQKLQARQSRLLRQCESLRPTHHQYCNAEPHERAGGRQSLGVPAECNTRGVRFKQRQPGLVLFTENNYRYCPAFVMGLLEQLTH